MIVRPSVTYYFRETAANNSTEMKDYDWSLSCAMDDTKENVLLKFTHENGILRESITISEPCSWSGNDMHFRQQAQAHADS